MKDLQQKLQQAGLSFHEAIVYVYLFENHQGEITQIINQTRQPKSSIYRAIDSLTNKKLILLSQDTWKRKISVTPLSNLISYIEKQKRKQLRLLQYFRSLDQHKGFMTGHPEEHIEVLDEQETLDMYLELSHMKWDAMLAFGNWEDLNSPQRNLVSIEKQFVQNRLKHGGRAFVSLTKGGDLTKEIVDFQNNDKLQNRITKSASLNIQKPFWVNAFEGNHYVQVWNVDRQNNLSSTLIHSPTVSQSYKTMIYSSMA